MKIVTVIACVLATLVSSGASAQAAKPQSGWNNILAAAKKEGKVVLYIAAPLPTSERVVAGFKQAYRDLPIEFMRLASGPLLGRLDQERTAGTDTADVFVSTEINWYRARTRDGTLLKPAGPSAANWPAKYLHEGTVPTVGMEPIMIAYNKNLVSTPPTSHADLLKPEFRNRLGISDLASTFVVAWYEWMEKGQEPGYYPKLKAQNPKIYAGAATAIGQAVASGEIGVGNFANSSTTQLIEQGAPIGLVMTKPSMVTEYMAAALGWSKRPNAALVLLEYLMSREGQSTWHSKRDSVSPLPGIPGSLDSGNLVSWNPSAYPPEAVAKYRDYWTKSLK